MLSLANFVKPNQKITQFNGASAILGTFLEQKNMLFAAGVRCLIVLLHLGEDHLIDSAR